MSKNTKTISEFKTKLAGGGARPNLFEVKMPNFPAGIIDQYQNSPWGKNEQEDFAFMCKAAQLPASNTPSIPVPFRGRILKVAGDRTFDDWTVTIINDEDFRLRTAFEKWANGISKLDDGTGIANPTSYMANAIVRQLGRGNALENTNNREGKGNKSVVLKTYTFIDMFPTEISTIDLSYDSTDTIEEFTVTFALQYYLVGYQADGVSVHESANLMDQAGNVPATLSSNDFVDNDNN
jgi:hypothetical protein